MRPAAPGPRTIEGVYAIIGLDGTGKTTVARLVAEHLTAAGRATDTVWLREPRFFTFAVLGILRLLGMSRIVTLGDHDDIHTDVSRHPILFRLYSWSVTFDYFLGYWRKILPRRLLGHAVVCDRFAWDTAIDLALSGGLGERFFALPEGAMLLDLSRRHRTVILTARPETIRQRRPILLLDPRLPERERLYSVLAARHALPLVPGDDGTEGDTAARVVAALGLT